ncbi:MAG: hypothetical protein QM500_19805 [Methylococcales bacterium]
MNQNEEFHEFEVDKAIVGDLIYSQNGTIATAIRELVMNAIDAMSLTCEIRLGATGFEIIDQGQGFGSRENIEKFFKRFGEPHTEGDAIFGRFRIGRGQIMAFGSITWHSDEFKMKTDVSNSGHGFTLIEDKDDIHRGCKVYGNFYSPINDWDLRTAKEEICKLVKYAEQDVSYNGIPISYNHSTQWDYEDEDVKIIWNPNREDGIMLYSLGVFVKDINRHHYGINADIVTKKALKLNMARNEVSENDPLWKKISVLLQEQAIKEGRSKIKGKQIDENTRRSLIRQVLQGNIEFDEARRMPLIRDCRGHTVMTCNLWTNKRPLTISPSAGDRVADRLASRKMATVLHYDELRIWGADSLEELIELMAEKATTSQYRSLIFEIKGIRIEPFDKLAMGVSDKLNLVKQANLKPREASARTALQYASGIMSNRINYHVEDKIAKRQISIGESDVADGWTDALSFIAIGRHMLPLLDKGYYGAVQLATLMLHEYCHNENDMGSHEHDFIFYERYHDISSAYKNEVLGHTALSLYTQYQRELMKRSESLPDEAYNQFKYPVINDLQHYIGQVKGNKLSTLAVLLLDSSKANYSITKTKFEAKINYHKSNDIYKQVDKALKKAIKNDGVELPDEQAIEAISKNWEAANKIIHRETIKTAEEWADQYGHDASLMKKLFFRGVGFSDLLSIICQDKNSGLYAFEGAELYPTRILGSATYEHRFRSPSFWGCEGRQWVNKDMAEDKTKRTEYALTGIKDIVKGIIDEDEKREFIETFLSPNLAIQLK